MLQFSAICLLGQVRPELVRFEEDFVVEEVNAGVAVELSAELVRFEDDFIVEEDNLGVVVELSADAEVVVFEAAIVVSTIRVVG